MLSKLYWKIKDWWEGKPEQFGSRSPEWRKLRNQYIKANPDCELCGKKAEQVHHQIPVSVDKSKELDWENLMSVCSHCHFYYAHLGSYRSYNIIVKNDSEYWKWKRKYRP